MLRTTLTLGLLAGAFAAGPAAAQIHITPAIGAYIPASDIEDLRNQAENSRLQREATLGLGLNVELGMLRASIAYASGAKLTEEGVNEDDGSIGDGSVLAAAADIVIRPLPRLGIQPYLLAGGGVKRMDYSFDDEGLGSIPLDRSNTELTLHAGAGVDFMFGPIGIMAEVSDFISQDEEDKWAQHDAFVLVGVRLRLGGN